MHAANTVCCMALMPLGANAEGCTQHIPNLFSDATTKIATGSKRLYILWIKLGSLNFYEIK
jgi:hypothetical protein